MTAPAPADDGGRSEKKHTENWVGVAIRQPSKSHAAIMAVTEAGRERFKKQIQKGEGPDACWIWTGKRNKTNYGKFNSFQETVLAHRVAFFLHHGTLDPKLCICHRCDNPPCVNPAHLFAATIMENQMDCKAKGRAFGQKMTHCKRGHEYTPENTYRTSSGVRYCRICFRARVKQYYHRRNARLRALKDTPQPRQPQEPQ